MDENMFDFFFKQFEKTWYKGCSPHGFNLKRVVAHPFKTQFARMV